MKVSVEGILGSAQTITSQRVKNDAGSEQRKEVRSDSVNITSRVNTRLDGIEKELRDTQTSLTKNQIIEEGILRLREDYARGGEEQKSIFNAYRFNNEQVLRGFVGDTVSSEILDARGETVSSLVKQDTAKIRQLQVEVDNLMASNLADQSAVDTFKNSISAIVRDMEKASPTDITSLSVENVMRLTK